MATASTPRRAPVSIRALVGSGDRIALFTAPFAIVGLIANIAATQFFAVGGPPFALQVASAALLVAGVGAWAWSVVLILAKVPRGELITSGPFSLVRHPLYTAVALLVLPAAGFLLNTWLGLAVGIAMYAGVRIFAPAEEDSLARTFGPAWDDYTRRVKAGWM